MTDDLVAMKTAQADRIAELEEALGKIIRLSEEVDDLTELSAKEIVEALVNCEQTARAALAARRATESAP